jgi:hypothetical protein
MQTINRLSAPSVNGHVKRPAVKSKAATRRPNRKAVKHARRLAGAVGAVGVGVLSLSVTHCTESIMALTGSHWTLCALLAIGIDAGMVASELAELAAHNTKASQSVRPWARGYTIAAVLLSVLLNGYAFGMHARSGMLWASWLLGTFVPCSVYALGRVAGYLWQASE